MARLDTVRNSLGLSDLSGCLFDARGYRELTPREGESSLDGVKVQRLPSPNQELLASFRALERESKTGQPKRPLPITGEPAAWRIQVSASAARILLPIFIMGEREEGIHLEINVAARAEVTIVMVTVQIEQPSYIQLNQGEGSRVQYDVIKMPQHPSWQLLAWQANLARDAHLTQHALNLDSSAYQVGRIRLNEPGAEVKTMSANYIASFEEMRVDVAARHFAGQTRSRIWAHGIVENDAYGVYASRGVIDGGSAGSDSYQESRFLSLGPQARADNYPVLKIDEYDVKAGHAASVSQLNEDTLYYLQSRGMSRDHAQRLVTTAYLQPVIDSVVAGDARLETAAAWLQNYLHEKVSQ